MRIKITISLSKSNIEKMKQLKKKKTTFSRVYIILKKEIRAVFTNISCYAGF